MRGYLEFAGTGYRMAKAEDEARISALNERLSKIPEVEALLDGAATLFEAGKQDHAIALVYQALDMVRSI